MLMNTDLMVIESSKKGYGMRKTFIILGTLLVSFSLLAVKPVTINFAMGTNTPNLELTKAMPYYPTMRDAVNNGLLRPAIELSPNYNQVEQLFYKDVYKVLTKEQSSAVALDNLSNQIHTITKFPIKK